MASHLGCGELISPTSSAGGMMLQGFLWEPCVPPRLPWSPEDTCPWPGCDRSQGRGPRVGGCSMVSRERLSAPQNSGNRGSGAGGIHGRQEPGPVWSWDIRSSVCHPSALLGSPVPTCRSTRFLASNAKGGERCYFPGRKSSPRADLGGVAGARARAWRWLGV